MENQFQTKFENHLSILSRISKVHRNIETKYEGARGPCLVYLVYSRVMQLIISHKY